MEQPDQSADIPAVDNPYVGATEVSQSGMDSPPGDLSARAGHRSASIRDTRFPSGWAYLVAWDVVSQGNSDLSTMLCRSAAGDYFLRCRSGDEFDVASSIIPLSDAQAAGWFDQLPVHFTHRDARWQ